MRDGRLRRFLGGLGLGYIQTVATIVVGLWMTPYLLRHLGSHDYGLWLLGTQVLTYLALLDVGVIALVPREIAAASGRANADGQRSVADPFALQTVVGDTARLVLWQWPAVAVAAILIVLMMPSEWAALRWPLAFVMLTFVLTFPLRLFGAILQGLQELTFLGAIQIASWAAGAAVTVFGAWRGWALYALALGWITTQFVSTLVAWRRISISFPDVLPHRLPALTFEVARRQLSRGAWISVNQIAQVLLVGTDLVVIGKLLGPEAVVPYACTGRLVTMLANQPQMFMQMALPALSELRTSAPRERLFEVSRSMAQAMLLLSGGIVAVVVAVNGPFVAWWVGESRFAGMGITALLLTGMLLRHLNATATYTLFCFGNERRLALTSIADGLTGVVAMLVLVPVLGLYGAAIGPLAGTCLVSLPNNFRALAREEGASPISFVSHLSPWIARLAVILIVAVAAASFWKVQGVPNIVALALGISVLYGTTMLPVLTAPPLGTMLNSRIGPYLAFAPAFLRRGAVSPAVE